MIRLRRLSGVGVAAMLMVGCSPQPASSAPRSPSAAAAVTPTPQTPAPGVAVALKATATVSFNAGSFSSDYTLASDSNPTNSLILSSGQAFLDLGSSTTQELHVTIVGGAAPGVELSGPNEVLASFTDDASRQGGIATVGQGVCTLRLAAFGDQGLAGSLDCENVVPLMGSSSPVAFQATIQARPA